MQPRQDSSRLIDVDARMDAAPISPFLLFIVTLCALVALLDGFDTLAITYVAPVIAKAWQLPKEMFGPVFAAHYAGAAVGAGLFGLLADRFGRRPAIIWSTAVFAVCALATPLSQGFVSLLVLRALTGVGLGGALSNVIALVSEYAPSRSRATLVSAMYAAFPLGGVIGGPLSAYVLAHHGWEAVFIIGGIAPLVLMVALVFMLPESVRFLVARGAPAEKIAALLSRCMPGTEFTTGKRYVLAHPIARGGQPLSRIFTGVHLRHSLLLGGASFITQMIIIYIISWMPTLLLANGLDLSQAILTSATFSLGGIVGSLLLARIVDKAGSWWPLTAAFVIAALAIAAIGQAPSDKQALLAAVALAGGLIVGAQVNLSAYCATVYPTEVRSTGLGWVIGLGRVGAISGALLGTAFVATGLALPWQYALSGAAALVAALLVHRTGSAGPRRAPARSVPELN
jgi:AAHS family 4-hydroxybenzoate transporter-like MFS transporter